MNIGNPNEISLREMAENGPGAVRRHEPDRVRARCRPTIPRCAGPTSRLARRVLDGWEPQVSVEEGLARTHAYFVSELARPSSDT